MNIKVEYCENRDEVEDLWVGRDPRQLPSSSIGRGERERMLDKLSRLLSESGTVTASAWDTADFHFNPDPDLELPWFIQIIFNAWPKGLLRKVISLVCDHEYETGEQFYIHIDKKFIMISILADGFVVVYVIDGEENENAAKKIIENGLSE
jgi:hypothetical protein